MAAIPANVLMNVFRQDAFSGLTLTDQINRVPYMPNLLGQLNIFEDRPIYTTAIQIDRVDRVLTLVPTSDRGAPLTQRQTEKRQARYFDVPRLAESTTIYAQEMQNVRSETDGMMFQDLQELVATRLTGPSGLTSQIEYTWEYHRLGAIQGILYDAGGGIIKNWYNEFGITQPTPASWNLVAQAAGSIIPLCNAMVRTMSRAGKGAFIPNVTEVHALCGDTFFDDFTNHVDVRASYQNWAAFAGSNRPIDGATELRVNRAFTTFQFGGIYWHNYRGSDDNSTIAVGATAAKFFPVKAPGVFLRALAPGEGMGDVNTKGVPMRVYRDIDQSEEQKWVRFDVKSFPLHICTRPEILQAATI